MNLEKLFEVQRGLDAEIAKNHPRVPDEDRLEKRVLALLVELGELANEWRGFKFWSQRQKPRSSILTTEGANEINAVKYQCGNCEQSFAADDSRLIDLFGDVSEECPECEEGLIFAFRSKNPLLEEYVDCLHFALSIGLQLNIPLMLDWGPYRKETITEQFIDLMQADWSTYYTNVYHGYCRNLELLIGLGEMLGFDWEQIETAYLKKNEINYHRQDTGY